MLSENKCPKWDVISKRSWSRREKKNETLKHGLISNVVFEIINTLHGYVQHVYLSHRLFVHHGKS